LLCACAVLAGCGSSTKQAEPAGSAPKCKGGAMAEQGAPRARLNHDLVVLRKAAVTMKHYAQDGNAATNNALDRFMIDVADEMLPAVVRSRYIDRAAAIVSPYCYLCFQTLESNRPFGAVAKLPCD
jgi:hypothetical protein